MHVDSLSSATDYIGADDLAHQALLLPLPFDLRADLRDDAAWPENPGSTSQAPATT